MEMAVKKHVWKRTIRYWSMAAEKMVFAVVICTLFYVNIISVGSMEADFYTYFVYQVMMGLMLLLMGQMNSVNTHLPMTMSFGAGRKETLWGMQISNVLTIAQLWVFAWITIIWLRDTKVVIPPVVVTNLLAGYAALLLVVAALGQLGVMVSLRFGNKGKTIFIVAAILLSLGIIFAVMFFALSTLDTFGGTIGEMGDAFWQKLHMIEAAVAAAGVLLYAVALAKMKKALMNYEVGK